MKKAFLLWMGLIAMATANGSLAEESAGGRGGVHGYAVAVCGEDSLRLAAHEDEPFPMMSVVKLPLAIAVLHEVEQGRLALGHKVATVRQELDTDTWSPMLKKHPEGGVFSVQELLQWCISESDNNACNILFSLVGGAEKVQGFFHQRYGRDFPLVVACSEEAFKDRRMMEANHVTPRAMAALLQDLCKAAKGQGDMMQQEHAQLLLGMMEGTATGARRLKAGLSEGVRFAHKTGSSGTTADGFTLALNDVGCMTLPNGRTACIASFISRSYVGLEALEAAHAHLARQAEACLAGKPIAPEKRGCTASAQPCPVQ